MYYAVLIRISPGYPPVVGKLHTRYAPVRHCHCWPFDLHVLGLPLAFILSQDQTLHCKFDIVFPIIHREYVSDILLAFKASLLFKTRYLLFLMAFSIFSKNVANFVSLICCFLLVGNGLQNYNLFLNHQMFFKIIFEIILKTIFVGDNLLKERVAKILLIFILPNLFWKIFWRLS